MDQLISCLQLQLKQKILLQRGIKPEEDIKKLERKVKSETKRLGENPDKLDKK